MSRDRNLESIKVICFMEYQKIYDRLIKRAQNENRKKRNGTYYEQHHIIPRCIGGSDDFENLVLLTAREHFLAHKILCEIQPDNLHLFNAYWMMCNMKSNTQERNYNIGNRDYERLKLQFSSFISNKNMGENNPAKRPEVRKKISQALMGHVAWNDGLTKETNDSVAAMAVKQKNIKRWNAGLTKDDPRVLEQSKNSSKARTGKARGKYNVQYAKCMYCDYVNTISVINRSHNDKCKNKF